MAEPLRMDAYYYSFDETGVDLIDRILSAVAVAGKRYHHTEAWTGTDENEVSEVSKIQAAAHAAAEGLTERRPPIPADALAAARAVAKAFADVPESNVYIVARALLAQAGEGQP